MGDMSQIRMFAVAICALLLAACAGDPGSPTTLAGPPTTASDAGSGSDGPSEKGGGSGTGSGDPAGTSEDSGGSSGSSSGRTGGGGADRGDDPGEGNDGGPVAGHATGGVLYPEGGEYSYEQSGFREFCTASCDREPLPARQRVAQTVQRTIQNGAVVVSEQNSDGGTVRMTTRYQDRAAAVEEVYTRLRYDAFDYEKTYRPDPPVVTLVSRLTVGRTWEGSWRGDVSGHYEAAVVSSETVPVGGRRIDVVKIFSVTEFRGELKGRSDLVAWVDPHTLTVVKSKGVVHLESSLGTYNTKFQTTLLDGPPYP